MTILSEIRTTAKSIASDESALQTLEAEAEALRASILRQNEQKARQEQTLAETKARLIRQMQEITPAALVEILLDKGITCLGDEFVAPKDVILESARIFTESFWVTGREFEVFGSYNSEADALCSVPSDLKHFIARTPDGRFSAITGLCSVGAIGLVRSMKADGPEASKNFSTLFYEDWTTRIACEAVAKQMRAECEFTYAVVDREAPESIVSANDNYLNKEQVIRAFKNAAEDADLLAATELWGVRYAGSSGYYRGAMFPSKAAAEQFIEEVRNTSAYEKSLAGTILYNHGQYPLEPVRVVTKTEYEARAVENETQRVIDLTASPAVSF